MATTIVHRGNRKINEPRWRPLADVLSKSKAFEHASRRTCVRYAKKILFRIECPHLIPVREQRESEKLFQLVDAFGAVENALRVAKAPRAAQVLELVRVALRAQVSARYRLS